MNSKTVIGYVVVAIIVGIVVSGGFIFYYSGQISSYKNEYTQAVNSEAEYKTLANYLVQHMNVTYSQGINLTNVLATPRIGIVTAMAMEQAPILASMSPQGEINISGYEFFIGTIAGKPVVSVRSGEKEYAVTTATTLMDTYFNIKAALLSGTAGARDPNVTVGDVVVSAFVVDKSSIHYHRGTSNSTYSETPYTGVEIVNMSPILNSKFGGFGEAQVVPSNASVYGYGYGVDTSYTYVEDLPSSLGLLTLAEQYALPPTPLSYVTGGNMSGTISSYVISGVIGSANQWTEPLTWMSQQNALYESDAGENEGMGFAYVNTHFGIPWLVIRGISDSPWYPSTYEGVYAADAAANVTIYVIEHFSTTLPNLYTTTSFSELSPMSNAYAHGYIVANKVYYNGLQPVMIQYTSQNGSTMQYIVGSSWNNEYSYNYTPVFSSSY
ncbi:MAG: 5'-methylthioadenosine/S-adenosylhomocysteine nucleosidase [Conexivisphaerales archaeon]